MAYSSAGVARSEREEHSRERLWQYVDYCCSNYEDELDYESDLDFYIDAQDLLLEFARSLKTQTLTPEQETLRKRLERIGRKSLIKCDYEDDLWVFDIESNDNERAEFANEPLEWAFGDNYGDTDGQLTMRETSLIGLRGATSAKPSFKATEFVLIFFFHSRQDGLVKLQISLFCATIVPRIF